MSRVKASALLLLLPLVEYKV